MLILASVLFYITYQTATKEIDSTNIASGNGMSSFSLTPFNYDQYIKQTGSLSSYLDFYTGNNSSKRNANLEHEAKRLRMLTYILAVGGIMSLIIAIKCFLNYRKSLKELEVNKN